MRKRLANLKLLQRLSAAKLWIGGSVGITLLAVFILGIPKWQVLSRVTNPKEKHIYILD